MKNVSRADYWDAIYRDETVPGWDLGAPSPALKQWLKRRRSGRIAVLGCGFGHDARALAAHGMTVDAFDISPRALAGARRRSRGFAARKRLKFRRADLFKLPQKYARKFDYVYEYTCFCAVDPRRRAEFARVTHALLRPGGRLIGCFYNHGRPGGPPFDVTHGEVERLFKPWFEIEKLGVTPHSVPRRKGAELWAEFTRRDQELV